MSTVQRARHTLFILALCLPAWASAADTPAQPTPHRRAADPVLVRTLQAHRWTLQSAHDSAGRAIDAAIVPGQPFVMSFDGANFGVQGGCNRMNGSWRISPQGQLLLGRLAATMKACEAPLMKADTALSTLLTGPLAVQLTPGSTPSLRLQTAANDALVLSGQATPESLYGAATQIFLEVAPQTVECKGAGAPTSCLRVRERRFDKQGLRIDPPGAWTTFHGAIQGYTHTPGVRNVLRIKRYKRYPVPADASAYLYVLDLVVESETVPR